MFKCQVIFSAYFQLLIVGVQSPNSYSLVDSWILLQISDLRIYVGGVILSVNLFKDRKKNVNFSSSGVKVLRNVYSVFVAVVINGNGSLTS